MSQPIKYQAGKTYLDEAGNEYRILEISGRGRNWSAWVTPKLPIYRYTVWFNYKQVSTVLTREKPESKGDDVGQVTDD